MTETEKCSQCGKDRGKKAKPWQTCRDCKAVLCLYCAPANRANPQCSNCRNAHYEAEQKKRRETPVECQECHAKKLPDEMTNPYVPTVCKECETKKHEAEAAKKAALEAAEERAWVPGTKRRVVVDGRYTYESDLPVKIGTTVLLPESWLGEVTSRRGPWQGTVTSFITDYTGPCARILKICAGSEAVEQKLATPSAKDFESIADQVVERYKLNDQDCRELAMKLLMRAT